MSRKQKIFIAAIVVLVLANIVQFVVWTNVRKSEKSELNREIASLEATIAAYGMDVTCWTVSTSVKAGDVITEESLESLSIPSTYVSSTYITNVDEILGKTYKVPLSNGTPITYDMILAESITDDMREYDIMLDKWTVGLEVGDYIDIRVIFPYSDDYIVIPHKKVLAINGETLKVYLTEEELLTYNGACLDWWLNEEYGASLYATTYIEPGLQQAAVKYYAVPDNIQALMQYDPNIVDKANLSDLSSWRNSIEELLVIFRDEDDTVDVDGGKIAAGRTQFNDAVKNDASSATSSTPVEDESLDDVYWESTLDETAVDTEVTEE